jgi:predicted DNA-binding transcriptional regulator YafY
MKRADRLFGLLQELRTRPAPITAAHLAEALEVSKRTIYRDIDSLKASGALIDGAAGFGYTLTEDPMLPPLKFTEEETEAIILGLSSVGEIADPALATAANEARAKIVAAMPDTMRARAQHAVSTAKNFRERPTPGVDPAGLRAAAWQERVLAISYVDAKGDLTEREVWPLSISYLDESDLLIAWCALRQDHRGFRLDRIVEARETGASFRPHRASKYREFLEKLRLEREAGGHDSTDGG